MSAHPTESRLIDLATGLLEPDDAQTIIEHLRRCAECERRFQGVVADYEAVRATPRPAVLDGRIELNQPASSRAMWPRIIVAAAILVVVGVGALRFANHNRLPEYWIPVTHETNVLRGSENNGIADALRAYQDRDAATAVKDLQAFQPPADDSSTLRDLYLASALINAGHAHEGLEVLDRHDIQSMPTPWRYEAEWVKYIGLRRAGRDEEAQSWLEKLSVDPGPNSARVRAELKRRKD